MLAQALEIGLSHDAFWNLTPREFQMVAEASVRRMGGEYRRAMWTAWHTAALMRLAKLPALDKLLDPEEQEPELTPAEQLKRDAAEHARIVERAKGAVEKMGRMKGGEGRHG